MSIPAASGSSTTALHSRFSRLFAIVFSLCGERGPRRETLQSPNRDRCCCQHTSSLTCPLPQTHAFRRASQSTTLRAVACRILTRHYHRSKQVPSAPSGQSPVNCLSECGPGHSLSIRTVRNHGQGEHSCFPVRDLGPR